MTLNSTINRPLSVTTETENISLSGVLIEDGANDLFSLDIKANIGGNDRLYCRLNIIPVYNGTKLEFNVQSLDFLGQAANTYADAKTSPFTDLDADTTSKATKFSGTDLHPFHIAAGDPTAS